MVESTELTPGAAKVIDRLRRQISQKMAAQRIPQHLLEGPQPVLWGSTLGARGPVGESSFAVQKDRNLGEYPNWLSRQPAVHSALRTRVSAITSREFSISPHDADNPADVQQALIVERELEMVGLHRDLPLRRDLRDVRASLLERKIFYGAAFAGVRFENGHLVEIDDYQRSAMQFWRGDPMGIAPEDRRSGWQWWHRYSSKTNWVEPMQMIIVTSGASRWNPWGVGVVDALYWLSFFEGVVMPMWAKWLERHAAPWVIGKTNVPANFDALDDLLAASFDNPNLRLPTDTEIEIVHPNATTQSIFQSFVSYANELRREVILGSSLTTAAPQPHGSYALANIHQDSTEEILQGDAADIDQALTWSASLWIANLNPVQGATRLPDGRVAPPRIETSIERQKDVNVLTQQLQTAHQYVDIPKALIYELFPDIRQPSEGEEVIPAASAAPQGAPPGDDQGLAAVLGGGAEGSAQPPAAQSFAEPSVKASARAEFLDVQ